MKSWLGMQQFLEVTEPGFGQKLCRAPLVGLSKIYQAAGRCREKAYRLGFRPTAKLPCRVICVGNLTVGGTGKTPTVDLVCRTLLESGERVGIISRGYGRRTSPAERSDILVVSDGSKVCASSRAAGDEPLMLARRLPEVPVLVGKSRYRAGQEALARFNLQTLVLDDGFQHLQLSRDLNILVLDGRKPFGNGYCLPAGSLRESPQALARADLILLTRICSHEQREKAEREIRRYNSRAPVVIGCHQPKDLISLQGDQILPLSAIEGKSVVALCAIADPGAFAATLKALSAEVIEAAAFADHHWYSAAELRQVNGRVAAGKSWGLVTTEKDAVRIQPGLLQCPVWVLRIDMVLVDGKELWEEKLKDRGKNAAISSPTGWP
ncbi:MAG: tetraacyldisaccharide 4'-kinase [bacterium]